MSEDNTDRQVVAERGTWAPPPFRFSGSGPTKDDLRAAREQHRAEDHGEPSRFAWLGRLIAALFKRPREARFPEDAELRPRTDNVITGDGSGEALPPFDPEHHEPLTRDEIEVAESYDASRVRLSQYFTLAEFTESDTAKRFGLDNTPPEEVLANLYAAAAGMEVVRDVLGGKPIIITSGYRAPLVNEKVGSKPSSAHVQGYAVDFKCPSVGPPAKIVPMLAASGLQFDQLINEYDAWVHISFDPRARRQVFRIG